MKLKLFLSLALLTTIGLSANDQEAQIYLSMIEVQEIFDNPHRSYVYVGKEASNMAEVIDEISKFEENQNSPIWGLKDHISKGFSVGNYEAVALALEQAETIMNNVDPDRTSKLSQDLGVIVQLVAEEQLTLDAEMLAAANIQAPETRSCGDCNSHCLRLLAVKEKVDFLNKVKFREDVTFYDDVRFKDTVRIDGTLSVADEIVNCDLTVGCNISINDSVSNLVGNIVKNGTSFIHNFPGTASLNTFVGQSAGNFTMTGTSNTSFGVSALVNNTIGNSNTAVGVNASLANTTGNSNTALGVAALVNNTIGSNNIAIGFDAGNAATTGNFNIYIGNIGVAAEGNTTRIGDLNQTRTFISGIRGVTTGVADAIAVLIDSNGQLGTVSSSKTVKHNIQDMSNVSSSIYNLNPVTFVYNSDASEKTQYGLIAEEVADVFPGIVVRNAHGQPETVQYHVLPVLLLNEMKKLAARVAVLEAHLN